MRLIFLFFILILSLFLNVYYLWNSHSTKLTNALQVNNEIKNYGVFCVGEERPDICYWFNNRGVLMNEATTIVGNISLKINEVSDYKPEINKQFLEDYLWKNMAVIIEFLKSGKLDVKNISFIRNDQDLIVVTGGVKVLFSLRFNPQNNIAGLLSALDKNKMKNVSQIDLRVENKIFYK